MAGWRRGKIDGLLACGASVTVVAPELHVAVRVLTDAGAIAAIGESPLELQIRSYAAGEAADYELVIAATGVEAVDDAVHRDARAAGVWVNVADDPARCSFVLPAVAHNGAVSIAVSTGGSSPASAGWLRDRVLEALPARVGDLAALLDEGRRRVHERHESTEALDWRGLLDGPLPDMVGRGDMDRAAPLSMRFSVTPAALLGDRCAPERAARARNPVIGNTLPVGPTETAAAARPRKRSAPGSTIPDAPPPEVPNDEEVIGAIILASRVMVAIAVRSLAGNPDDVTLPQYRTLVELTFGGPRRLADLADALSVSPSTATRMCDRLVRKELVSRTRDELTGAR